MSRMAATSPASMSCSYVITSTPGGGAIFITTSRLSARCSRYATLHQPCPSSVAKSSVGGTSSGPYARSIIRRRVCGDCRYLVMLSIECLPPGRDPTDARLPAPKGTGSLSLISDQWKILTPPGPTSRPTTMRTMPHNSCFWMIAKMPEITRIAAIIHRIVAICVVLPASLAMCLVVRQVVDCLVDGALGLAGPLLSLALSFKALVVGQLPPAFLDAALEFLALVASLVVHAHGRFLSGGCYLPSTQPPLVQTQKSARAMTKPSWVGVRANACEVWCCLAGSESQSGPATRDSDGSPQRGTPWHV